MLAPSHLLYLVPLAFATGLPTGFFKERVRVDSIKRWCLQLAPAALFPFFPWRYGLVLAASFIGGMEIGRSMIGIGLTGGIATGKSTVSQCLERSGAIIIDADRIARQVVMPGRAAYRQIVKTFGPDVLNPLDQTIDRAKLGAIIFNEPAKRKQLNACTHKFIIWQMFKDLMYYRLVERRRLVVLDAPLLFETGFMQFFCFPVVVVACAEAKELERLMKRDQITEEAARKRIQAQMKLEDKVQRADLVLQNNGSMDELIAAANKALQTAAVWTGATKEVKS